MRFVMFVVAALILGVSGMASAAEDTAPATEKKVRVGVFDSRAIAVAYAQSKSGQERFQQEFRQLKKELDKAEASGDKEKAESIKAAGKAGQERLHLQGFGTASVREYLDLMKDKIPPVAKETGVDLIVSKWEVTYQGSGVEIVDITDELVNVFEPNERVLKIVQELRKTQPVNDAEIRKIKD